MSTKQKKAKHEYDLEGMAEKVRTLQKAATELKEMSGGIQAVERNADRVLSSVRMLEISVVEIIDILKSKD